MVEETTANFLDKISSAADVNGTIDLQSDKAPTKVNARFYYCTSPFDLRDSAAKRAQEVPMRRRERIILDNLTSRMETSRSFVGGLEVDAFGVIVSGWNPITRA